MIPELLQNIVGSVLRHSLTGLGGLLVAQGWVTADDWQRLLAGTIVFAAGLIWSLVQKWQTPPTPTA
jgi:membrane protein DedA with SNARE-associated domain